MEYTNREIETAFSNGDQKIYEVIFRAYYKVLCRYANGIVNDPDDAEELVQQVFVAIWEKRSEFKIEVSIKSYLYRAVHNRCLNYIAQSKVRTMYANEKINDGIPVEHPVANLRQKELQERIRVALLKLPEQCRIVFKLSRFEELKYSEIASHLGISIKTVENQMGKALRIMREELKEYLPFIIVLIDFLLKQN